jgi:N-acylneuraminate cytidylyltransferase
MKLVAAGVPLKRIWVSCENPERKQACDLMGVNFLLRDPHLCRNETSIPTWIRQTAAKLHPAIDIAWCQVCDPLFNEYQTCFDIWATAKNTHDSLVVCYPWRGYLMTAAGQPVGWSFGEHHTPSQQLPKMLTMPFTLSMLSAEAIQATGYHVGKRPYWYEATGQSTDIDTLADFYTAERLWQQQCTQPS